MRKKPEEELHSKGNPSSFGSHQIVGVTNFKDGQGGGRIRLNINVKFNNIQNSNITETHKSSSNTKHICVSLPLWRFQLTLYRSLPQLACVFTAWHLPPPCHSPTWPDSGLWPDVHHLPPSRGVVLPFRLHPLAGCP